MNKQDKKEIRAYINGRVALCIPPKQIYNELNDIYGCSMVSYMTVCRWVKKLKLVYPALKMQVESSPKQLYHHKECFCC